MKVLAMCASGATISIIVPPTMEAASHRGLDDFGIDTASFLSSGNIVEKYDVLLYLFPLDKFAEKAKEHYPNKNIKVLSEKMFNTLDGEQILDFILK